MVKNILKFIGGLVCVLAAVIAIQWGREALARAQAESEWAAPKIQTVSDLGTTQSLQILPVFEEAAARPDLEPEHGVSYLIKTDTQSILMDAGMTPSRWQHNLKALGLSPSAFDTVFISHLHPDHLGGQDAWWANTIALGSPALDLSAYQVYVPKAVTRAGSRVAVATQPQKIAQGVGTTGAIAFPELFPLSVRSPLNAEQSLVIHVAGQGLVVIMGCGHPSVERIVARAQAAFGEPIVGVVGGLHYEGFTAEQVQPHLDFVKSLNPKLVAVSPHDSSPAALQAFRAALPSVYQDIRVGQSLIFN